MSESKTTNQNTGTNIKAFLKSNFTTHLLLKRLVCFLAALAIVLPPSLSMNVWAQHAALQNYGGDGFLNIYITTNEGVAFSLFGNAGPAAVYILQSIISLAIFVAVLFTKRWYQSFLLSMAFLGGFFNIMDRTTVATFTYNNHATFEYNVVVDYFRFFTSAIFNFPDIFVLTGIIGATLLYFITTIITYSKLKKSEKPK